MTHDLDRHALAALARDLAMNVHPREMVLARHDLDEARMEEIEQDDFYRKTFDDYVKDWNKPTSARERMEHVGAAFTLEMMPPLAGRALSGEDPLSQAVEALKVMSVIGGAGKGKGDEQRGMAPGERFQITINMGAVSEVYDKPLAVEHESIPRAIEHER